MLTTRSTLLAFLFSCSALISTSVSAQDFPDPEEDRDSDYTMIDAAVMAFDTQANLKCTCEDPDDTSSYEGCLKKLERKAFEATKNAVKFNQESKRDLKSALSQAREDQVVDCSESGDSPDDSDGDEDLPE